MYRTAIPAQIIILSTILVLSLAPAAAHAQTEGRVSIGGSVTYIAATDNGVANTVSVGPLVRLNPKKGWGVAAALNWFGADLENPAGGDGPFGRMRVRPLMAGVAYTIGNPETLVSFSVVAGPSFNRAFFVDDFVDSLSSVPGAIDAENSIAVRPGISVTHAIKPRLAVVGFGGYMFNRPDVVYRNAAGEEFENRWKADSIALSVGLVYSLF
jgi:Outer membrane protein beta-barrel domain